MKCEQPQAHKEAYCNQTALGRDVSKRLSRRIQPPWHMAEGRVGYGRVANLRLAHVRDAEHELEDAVAARDGGAVADEHGARAVLWVADAREDDALPAGRRGGSVGARRSNARQHSCHNIKQACKQP